MKKQKKSKGAKVKVDNTLVTESDITLSLSRDSFKAKPFDKGLSSHKTPQFKSISFNESY